MGYQYDQSVSKGQLASDDDDDDDEEDDEEDDDDDDEEEEEFQAMTALEGKELETFAKGMCWSSI